ncbi:MAG: hypothetical protein JWM99_3182 [Verrucomicrobiales bacterium]|nr:hypothetical protein [Verrucomicrobiales bacterium]
MNKWEILAFLWASGVGLLLLRLVLGSIWLRLRLAREASVPNSRAESILSPIISEGRVFPTITETTLIESPSVFGCFRPQILLPKGLAEQFTDSQLRDVFIHEIGHIRRWDLWTNMLMSIAGALHWFNPSLNHPRLDRFLVRVDPPLKNVDLTEICDAISSAARAPVDEFKTIKVAYSVEEDCVTFLEAELFNIEFVVDDLSEAERLRKFLDGQGIDVFAAPIEADNFLGTQIEFSKRGLFFKPGRLTARGIASEIERAAAIIEDRATRNLPVPGLSKAISTRNAYSVPIPTATLWNATISGGNIAPEQNSAAMQLNSSHPPLAPGVYKSAPYSGYVIVPESNIDSLMIIVPRSDNFDPMPMFAAGSHAGACAAVPGESSSAFTLFPIALFRAYFCASNCQT